MEVKITGVIEEKLAKQIASNIIDKLSDKDLKVNIVDEKGKKELIDILSNKFMEIEKKKSKLTKVKEVLGILSDIVTITGIFSFTYLVNILSKQNEYLGEYFRFLTPFLVLIAIIVILILMFKFILKIGESNLSTIWQIIFFIVIFLFGSIACGIISNILLNISMAL